LDLFVTPTFLRASDFSSRTSEEVHARLTDFFFFISIPVPVYESRASNTPFSFGNTRTFTERLQCQQSIFVLVAGERPGRAKGNPTRASW
jgi:hypothetical protein